MISTIWTFFLAFQKSIKILSLEEIYQPIDKVILVFVF